MSKRPLKETVDWMKCIICQKDTREHVECPAKTKRAFSQGYKTFETNIQAFLCHMTEEELEIDILSLDEGSGVATTLTEHAAVWHKSCRARFNETKLQRLLRKVSERSSIEDPPHLEPSGSGSQKSRRLSTRAILGSSTIETNRSSCFFCDKGADGKNKLHAVMTLEVSERVRRIAETTNDVKLLAKFTHGDLVAQEAHYHRNCLLTLCNKMRDKCSFGSETNYFENVVLAELVSFLEEGASEDTPRIYKLADIGKMYSERLVAYGVTVTERIHTTRLKERLFQQLPNLRESTSGRDVLLCFENDVHSLMQTALEGRSDSDAVSIMHAAKLIRKDIANCKIAQFDGTFSNPTESIPNSLLMLMKMVLVGSSVEDDLNIRHKESITLSQLVIFNSVLRARPEKDTTEKHKRYSKLKETPIPTYIGLKIHAQTRSRGLIDTLFNLGICISYTRVMSLLTDTANSVCSQYEKEGVVCPAILSKNIFTTAAVDNIDYNPSSSTAQDSFHGTGISLFQHPSEENPGIPRDKFKITHSSKDVKCLPIDFTDVKQVPNNVVRQEIPRIQESLNFESKSTTGLNSEYKWLKHVSEHMQSSSESLTFAAFNACAVEFNVTDTSTISMLPLLYDSANNLATIKHCMDVVKNAVLYLNPGQTPVITVDQPLYALAKQIQWTWPIEYGEHRFVIILGGLHIEMSLLKMIGSILAGSGWTEAISKAGLCGPGTADSMLKASHVLRCRHAHEVTAVALYCLQQEAFLQAMDDGTFGHDKSFSMWCNESKESQSLFFYWSLVLETELTFLKFIRSIREANFELYINTLCELTPLLFAMDHTNYSRWLPIHIRDMRALEFLHPSILAEFKQGHFTVRKSKRPFSCIALDQAHEQNNEVVKGDGGAVGLTENPSGFRRWMLAGAEICRILQDFEEQYISFSAVNKDVHHDQYEAKQKKFQSEVLALIGVFKDVGNPFSKACGQELINIFTNILAEPHVISNFRKLKEIGKHQFNEYINDRISSQTKSANESIKLNRLQLLDNKGQTKSSKIKAQLQTAKLDCNLFSRLYIACQSRGANLDEFFCYENQRYPPALAVDGLMRTSDNKSQLLTFLLDEISLKEEKPDVTCLVVDGAAIVQMLSPKPGMTFADYSKDVFTAYIKAYVTSVSRIDVVFDQYLPLSLKKATRDKRGTGIRRKVLASSKVPRDWNDFLKNSHNKSELFRYLARSITESFPEDITIISTVDEHALSNHPVSPNISPCQQEEADTRMLLHAADASSEGHKKLMIRTVDTDVVVVAVALFTQIYLEQLWIAFGTGKNFKYIPIHEIAASMTNERSLSMLFFHAFTGCDSTSCFLGIGKKTAWSAWKLSPNVTTTFHKLSNLPSSIETEDLSALENFTVQMYDKSSSTNSVNSLRRDLFARKGRSIERIPPTQQALLQHIKRSAFQAGHVWRSSLSACKSQEEPYNWGWIVEEGCMVPFWTPLPEASKSCQELIKCGCRKGCKAACGCKKAVLPCTELCLCGGTCS